MSDTLGTREVGQEPLEELIEIQALSVDLREAVMACLCGGESRCWTIAELVERFFARSHASYGCVFRSNGSRIVSQ